MIEFLKGQTHLYEGACSLLNEILSLPPKLPMVVPMVFPDGEATVNLFKGKGEDLTNLTKSTGVKLPHPYLSTLYYSFFYHEKSIINRFQDFLRNFSEQPFLGILMEYTDYYVYSEILVGGKKESSNLLFLNNEEEEFRFDWPWKTTPSFIRNEVEKLTPLGKQLFELVGLDNEYLHIDGDSIRIRIARPNTYSYPDYTGINDIVIKVLKILIKNLC